MISQMATTNKTRPMSKKKRKPLIQQKHIVSLEVLLVLRWLLRCCEETILNQPWSLWLQIFAIMAILAGVLGWFLVIIQGVSTRSVEGTQRMLERLPVPKPVFFLHLFIFVANLHRLCLAVRHAGIGQRRHRNYR